MENSKEIIDSKEKREELVNHIEVLDKIKIIPYFPKGLFVGINHASNYYKTSPSTIQSLLERHKDEFIKDGVKKIRGEELRNYQIDVKENNILDNQGNYFIGNKTRSYTIIPKRALLRIGMLLKKSEIAKQVRQYLLEVEEITTNEQKEIAINKTQLSYIDNVEEDLKEELLKYNYENKKLEANMLHAIKRCDILGINKKESVLLIQQAIVENKDINKKILEKLEKEQASEIEEKKGILFQRITYIANNYFNNNYGRACIEICNRLKYKIGKDIYKEYYSKKNQSLAKPLTYAELILKHNAYDKAIESINELLNDLEEQDENNMKIEAQEIIENKINNKIDSPKKSKSKKYVDIEPF